MSRLRVLELYCGIGGCAAALRDPTRSSSSANDARPVAAVDINRVALRVYRHNFSHPTVASLVESVAVEQLRNWEADLWWLSPPCQPFTRRGLKRDLDDPRAATLIAILKRVAEVRPTYIALENVPGFQSSRGHELLLTTLERAGYQTVQEHILCPTDFGVPNRRRRYYLVASRGALAPLRLTRVTAHQLHEYLDEDPHPALAVEPDLIGRYRGALSVIDIDDPVETTNCFTSAYGRSLVKSGSYLATESGIRRFSPTEILRLLGFPPDYSLPADLPFKNGWRLAGNSLSVTVVRSLLSTVPELTGPAAGS